MMSGDRMNPSAERALHDRDYPAWLTYAAPRVAAIIHAETRADIIARHWSLMSRDLQVAVWDRLDAATRERVREARNDGANAFAQHMEHAA